VSDLTYISAVILGIVEGLTEFLPVSSTGHLTITEKLLGLQVDAPEVTAYTAIIQLGAIAATIVYFFRDIVRLVVAWFRGLLSAEARQEHDYSLAWAVIVGSIPVGIVGLAFKSVIEGALRSLWVVAAALILWSGVMWVAESRHAKHGGVVHLTRTQLLHHLGQPGLGVPLGLVLARLLPPFAVHPGVIDHRVPAAPRPVRALLPIDVSLHDLLLHTRKSLP